MDGDGLGWEKSAKRRVSWWMWDRNLEQLGFWANALHEGFCSPLSRWMLSGEAFRGDDAPLPLRALLVERKNEVAPK